MTAPTTPLSSRLDRLFNPQSATVIGASTNPFTIGGQVYGNLQLDFPGRLYPVNARAPEVLGDRAYASIDDLPEPVDLVVVMVHAVNVPDVIRSCIARGDGGACIISAGFSEAGAEGAALQAEISALAREHNFPVVGPNCVGFWNGQRSVAATFAVFASRARPAVGPVAIVSQSGGFGSFILNRAVDRGVRVSMFASTGNECDIDISSVLEYCIEQPDTKVVAVFAEAIREPDVFLRAIARARELDKQIISVSPGTSEAVARAVMSHTASIVGSGEVYAAVCEQYGVIQADSIEALLDYAVMFQGGKKMHGRRIGVITQSGGAGVLIAGNAGDEGLELPELTPAVQEELLTMLPPFASAKNPIDTTASFNAFPPETYGKLLQKLLDDDQIDAAIPVVWAGAGPQTASVAEAFFSHDKPIAPVVTIEPELLAAEGVMVFDDPTRAVRALAQLARATESKPWTSPTGFEPNEGRAKAAAELLAPVRSKPFVLEATAKEVLALYGIPVSSERVCTDEAQAVAAFESIVGTSSGKVALKILSYELPHKSDAGGLVLNVDSAEQVRTAYRALTSDFAANQPSVHVEGVLVQEMVSARLELAVGLQRDPVFGPMVALGLGGVLIELLGTPQLLHAPFGIAEAREAVKRIAGGRIGHGTRGLDEDQLEQLATIAVALGELALEHPSVHSVDVNPLMAGARGLVAVDALLVFDDA
jgi:acyl-CoA synthetase (NDP forming)